MSEVDTKYPIFNGGIKTIPSITTQKQTQQKKRKQPIKQTQKNRQSMFLPTSRLNRGQRKYCHCLMSIRSKNIVPYGICSSQSYRTLKQNPKSKSLNFNPRKTNCVMNYDYNQYSLTDVQKLATERGIPLSNPKTGKPNNKTSLVQLLTTRYITKHRQFKQPKQIA